MEFPDGKDNSHEVVVAARGVSDLTLLLRILFDAALKGAGIPALHSESWTPSIPDPRRLDDEYRYTYAAVVSHSDWESIYRKIGDRNTGDHWLYGKFIKSCPIPVRGALPTELVVSATIKKVDLPEFLGWLLQEVLESAGAIRPGNSSDSGMNDDPPICILNSHIYAEPDLVKQLGTLYPWMQILDSEQYNTTAGAEMDELFLQQGSKILQTLR